MAAPSNSGPADLAAIARDPDAFENFYRRHIGDITRFVARRVGDPHTVADLTADVFLAALDPAETYRPGLGSETAWLYGVAHNVVAAEHRRAARESSATGRIPGEGEVRPVRKSQDRTIGRLTIAEPDGGVQTRMRTLL